jgi:hypothetical protein
MWTRTRSVDIQGEIETMGIMEELHPCLDLHETVFSLATMARAASSKSRYAPVAIAGLGWGIAQRDDPPEGPKN